MRKNIGNLALNEMFVIKDNQGRFAHRESIRKIEKDTLAYVSFKVFTPECRGYLTKDAAERALANLNIKKTAMDIDTEFHLEQHIVDDLIRQARQFTGDTIVIIEKLVA